MNKRPGAIELLLSARRTDAVEARTALVGLLRAVVNHADTQAKTRQVA